MFGPPIEAGQSFEGSMVLPRMPNSGVNGVTGLKEICSAKLSGTVSNFGFACRYKLGILRSCIERI